MRTVRWVLPLLLLFPSIGRAQQSEAVKVTDALARMKSADWIERYKGFEEANALLESSQGDARGKGELRLALIHLLVTETAAAKNPRTIVNDDDRERESYSSYFGDLIGAVADLKDARAIPALLAVADTGGMATRGIAHFGKAALDPVLNQVAGKDTHFADGALFVIRDMLEYRTVSDSESLARIKNALRSALASPDQLVRMSAISAIEYLDEREEFVPLLTNLASSDPYKIQGQVATDGQDNGEVYPVRRRARILLVKIANHEAPIIDRGVPAP